MADKHTPGPWNANRDSSAGYNIVVSEVAPVDICVLSRRDKTAPEINANTLLVAAAPDMLEALRITRGNVASLGPAGALEPYAPYREWLAMLDRTIAKATGEQL